MIVGISVKRNTSGLRKETEPLVAMHKEKYKNEIIDTIIYKTYKGREQENSQTRIDSTD